MKKRFQRNQLSRRCVGSQPGEVYEKYLLIILDLAILQAILHYKGYNVKFTIDFNLFYTTYR